MGKQAPGEPSTLAPTRRYRQRPPAIARPALARGKIYAALSRSLSFPTDALLRGYGSGDFVGLIEDALLELDQADANAPGAIEVRSALAGLSAALAADLAQAPQSQTWGEDYIRLFDQGQRVPCPLYETEYTKAHLWQQTQAMADIAGFYRAFGVDAEAAGERPDHLALELEFMHLLCVKEALALAEANAEAAEICRSAQQRFVAEHLGTCTGIIATQAQEHSRLATFGAVATLVDRFVTAEAARLGVAPPPARGRALRHADVAAAGGAADAKGVDPS